MFKRQLGALFLITRLSLTTVPVILGAENKQVVTVAGDGTGDYNCGSSNADVQIQQALDYAASHPGTIVHLKGPFIYSISKQMSIGSYTTLEGDPTAKMRIADSASWSNSGDSTDGSNAMIFGKSSGVHDITFQGFEMDGNAENKGVKRGAGYYPAVILQPKCYNVTFQNMYVHNFDDDCLRVEYGSPINLNTPGNVIFRNNTIYKVGHEGLYAIGLNGVQFYNNDVFARTDCAVRSQNCNHVKIYNNNLHAEFAGSSSGALVELEHGDSDGIMDDIEIYNNSLHTAAGDGILCMLVKQMEKCNKRMYGFTITFFMTWGNMKKSAGPAKALL